MKSEALTLEDQDRQAVPVTDRFIKTPEAAAFIGFSTHQLEAWRFYGEGPPYSKFKRTVRYRISDLVAWMEARKVRPLEDA